MRQPLRSSNFRPIRPLKPAVLLDRDGVLVRDSGYLSTVTQLRWIPGVFETLHRLSKLDRPVIIVTNQSGVARGFFSEKDVKLVHWHIDNMIQSRGGKITAFYYCPFHDKASVPAYRVENHPDRKPNPGMLLKAAQDWNLDLNRSVMIGDKASDIEAGRRAGVRPYQFAENNLYEFFKKRNLFR